MSIQIEVIQESLYIIKANKYDRDTIIEQCDLIIKYAKELKNNMIDNGYLK